MKRVSSIWRGVVSLLFATMWLLIGGAAAQAAGAIDQDVTQGALRVTNGDTVVECPLRHTDVKASISGFVARVTVTQTFYNPSDEKIEAVLRLPLAAHGGGG